MIFPAQPNLTMLNFNNSQDLNITEPMIKIHVSKKGLHFESYLTYNNHQKLFRIVTLLTILAKIANQKLIFLMMPLN